MNQNDLKPRTPGPLNDTAPDPEIDDTGLPLDNQPSSNNANDVGEDENIVR